jgi:deoxyribonuclease I
MKTVLLAAILLLLSTFAHASGQHVIADFASAQRSFFWTKLYVNGGKDLYSNVPFITGQRLTVEQVYTADWIATHFGCDNRNCGHSDYRRAKADLHNLLACNRRYKFQPWQ